MQNNPLTERDLRQRLSVPPTFDVGHHVRELARVLLPAVLGALIIAGIVYQVVASKPAEYQNSVTAKIDSGALAGMTDVTVNTLAPPFVALSTSRAVLEDVAKRANIDTPPEQLAKDIDVSVQTSPSLVQVTSRAATADGAVALSDAVVSALDNAIINVWIDRVTKDVKDLQDSAADSAAKMVGLDPNSPQYLVLHADFESQLQRASQLQSTPPTRIVLLSQPGDAEKVAPLPLQQTLVAFVASVLIMAELLAFFNGRIGRRTNAAWVRRQAHRHGYSTTSANPTVPAWPLDTQVVLNTNRRGGGGVLLLHSPSRRATDYVAAATAGADAMTVHAVDTGWWRDPDVVDYPVAIAVIDAQEKGRRVWANAFAALDRYGIAVQLVVLPQRRGGRRLPGKGPAVDEATETESDVAEIGDGVGVREHAHESS